MEWNEPDRLSDLELDDLLREWKVAEPPRRFRRARLGKPALRRALWIGGLAAACLLALAAVMLWRGAGLPDRRIQSAERGAELGSFTPIPYTIPLGTDERPVVVRMDIPVAALLAAGFRMPAADPTAAVSADVLVGEDGSVHAIRLVRATSRN
jgi:hypothetical protein